MTTTDRSEKKTLRQQTEGAWAQAREQAPAQIISQLQGGVDILEKSHLADKSLKAGDKAPLFTLPDAVGKEVSLSSLLAQGPVVLTFYRGEWCPYCNLQLPAYQKILPQIKAAGATLVAVSPQTPDHSLSLVEKQNLEFVVLSDAGNKLARQFGIVFQVDAGTHDAFDKLGIDLSSFNGDDAWELPLPGLYIIDQQGVIRFAHVEEDFRRRLEPSDLLAQLGKVVSRK